MSTIIEKNFSLKRKKRNFGYCSHPVWGALLWRPEQTNTDGCLSALEKWVNASYQLVLAPKALVFNSIDF